MKAIKKLTTVGLLSLVGLSLAGCGNKITQNSLENQYYEINDGNMTGYLHFEKDGKLEVKAKMADGKLSDKTLQCDYKVLEEGKQAKVRLTINNSKADVKMEKTDDGLKINNDELDSMSEKEINKVFK